MRGQFALLKGAYKRTCVAVDRMRGVAGNYKCWLCRDLKPWHWPQFALDSVHDTDEESEDDWEPSNPGDDSISRWPDSYRWDITVAELRMSASSCHACAAILKLLEHNIPHLSSRRKVTLRSTHNYLMIDAEEGRKYPIDTFELYRHAPPADRRRVLWPAVRLGRSLSPSFTIEDARSLIGYWLEHCETYHEPCGATEVRREPLLPTRVIAVGATDEDPRLHETQPGETGRYVALSHCWGPPESLTATTTNDNFRQRKQAIPMKDLPLTFSDAVHLCRALGIPYLWIDSLCIIQGDDADWARESERMADVYGNATLTFSADGASSSQDGLLQPVTRRRLPPPLKFSCSSSPTADEGESNYVYGRRVFTYDGKGDSSRVHSFSNVPPWIYEPLRLRAWAFQEYLLSLRIVHFATGELLWDCRTIEACECRHQLDFSKRPQPNDPDHQCWYGPTMSTSSWWDLVERLSRRYLTYESDMLPALAGVAKVMSAEMPPGDCYIAGHWKSDLPFSLIWRRGGHMRYIRSHSYGDTTAPSHRQAKYIAPSWAWPSVVGPIYHDNDTHTKTYWHDLHKYWQEHVVCRVLSVSYELATSNPYGALRSGSIDIRGLTLMLYGCVDVQDTRRNGRHGRFKVRLKGDEIKVRFIRDEWQPDQAAGPEDVLYLPIVARRHHIEVPIKAPFYYVVQTKGLALKAVPEKDNTFVRVGLLRVHFYRRTQWALKELCQGKEPRAKDVLMSEFKLPERTVTII